MLKRTLKIFLLILAFVAIGSIVIFLMAKRPTNQYQAPQQSNFKLIKDPKTGVELVCNQIGIITDKDVSKSTVEKYVNEIKGKIILEVPETGTYSISFPGECDVQAIYNMVNFFKNKSGVHRAYPEYLSHPSS